MHTIRTIYAHIIRVILIQQVPVMAGGTVIFDDIVPDVAKIDISFEASTGQSDIVVSELEMEACIETKGMLGHYKLSF